MGILPSFLDEMIRDTGQDASQETEQIPREYGVNFDTGQPTGKVVEGKDAIKVWIWNCLQTQKGRYGIYEEDYGPDMEQYVGQPLDEYMKTDCRDEIEEALKMNENITGISDFDIELRTGGILKITFTAETEYGSVEVEQDV